MSQLLLSEMKSLANVWLSLTIAAVFAAGGCSTSTDPVAPLVVPEMYDSTSYAANTVEQYQLRNAITALTNLMKTGRTSGTVVDRSALESLWLAVRGNTNVYYQPFVTQYLDSLSQASGKTYSWDTPPTSSGVGGTYGGYLFSNTGLEMEQMVEKGLFSAALYHQATLIMQRTLTPASVDQLVALFGAHPLFPNTDKATVNPDRYAAAYAARRDQNDGNGLYTTFKKAAIKLQAAVKAGGAYENERNEALSALRAAWEKAIMATVINYTYAVVDGLSATTVTDQSRASAMHAYGECVGFLHGWKGVSQKSRRITDAQIDALLGYLFAPAAGPWQCYLFWQQPVVFLPRVVEARKSLQALYGFTDVEMESFRTNWVNAQNRQ